MNERFPRLFVTRQKKDDGAAYYGPYSDARLLREALIALRQIFPLRSCGALPKTVCLNYHIKQCLGPCASVISNDRYMDVVSELKLFLEGKRAELLKLLSVRMAEAAKKEDFEEAGRIKSRIEALSSIKEKSVSYYPAGELEELRNLLKIKGPIEVIEAFDVSNIMGKAAVGSMIYFYKGRPKKSEYRKFRIKTVSKIDDYAMMRELVRRRYSRSLEEKRRLPDLILIDGGKGHLSAVVTELEKLGLTDMPAIGIAKEFEHIYTKDSDKPIMLPRESKALHLLERVRDEAHRFAIGYHKKLMSKRIEFSELDEIRGVGPKRKKELLKHFSGIGGVKAASIEMLLKVKGMDERSARNIIEHFKK
jgi:excinuclease ABC subunit C